MWGFTVVLVSFGSSGYDPGVGAVARRHRSDDHNKQQSSCHAAHNKVLMVRY